MGIKTTTQYLISLILCLISFGWQICYASQLTLKQAERAALVQAPEIKALRAKSQSLSQSSIAKGQLSDPKLILGTMNVPVNTFSFNQEPMTQIQAGLAQQFPRGRSLHYRSLQESRQSEAEYFKKTAMGLKIVREVRLSWLNLYYWLHVKQIVLQEKKVFKQLLQVTESMLANNKTQQKDVIRAQLELTDLDNQLIDIDQQIDTARDNLGRWIGPTLARRAKPWHLPSWPAPPRLLQLQRSLRIHPVLKTDKADISSKHAGVNLARQQYMPGFSVGVVYGIRQGQDRFDGRHRPDFLTAEMSMDIPLFVYNRQDRTLKASEDELVASEENRMSDYRQLKEKLQIEYVTWQQQRRSARLYHSQLVPQAEQYAEATMVAYQNTQTDFPTLARAYVRELNTKIASLKAAVLRSTARVNLLYLQGK